MTPVLPAKAALLVAPPGAVIARHTAARLLGGAVPDSPEVVDLLLPAGLRSRTVGIDARPGPEVAPVLRSGVPVTPPDRTFVDLAADLSLVDLVALAGLPEPVVNYIVREDDGHWRLRFDLSWPEVKVAVEYDGRQHAESTRQWVRDVARREELDRMGWRIVVVLSADLFVHPSQTLERIVGALSDRGVRVRVTGREWARHFPDHRSAS